MKRFLLFSVAALTLFACAKNEAPVVRGEGNPVKFSAKVENTFEFKSVNKESLDGKKVRIAADATLDNATSVALVEGDNLVLENIIRWKAEQTEKTTFVGLYQNLEDEDHKSIAPAAPAAGLKFEYNLGSGDNYDFDYHDAFLVAVAKDVVPESTADLVFKHPFAKLEITVVREIDGILSGVELRNVVLGGTFNFKEGTVEEPEALSSVNMIKPGDDPVFEAVIMPVSAKPIIAVTVAGEIYHFSLANAVAFEANKKYTATLTIKDNTPVSGEAVGFTFDVVDWEAGSVLETSEIVPAWGVIGVGANWNEDIPMTCTLAGENATDGTWEADITYLENDQFKLRWNCEWALNVGMNPTWEYYGLGEFEDGILVEGSDKNIILETPGKYHLVFKYPAKTLVVTPVLEP